MSDKTAYLMIGPPGSGKSSWIAKNVEDPYTTEVISPDHLAYDKDGNYIQDNVSNAWFQSYQNFLSACEKGISVVVFDATLVRIEPRAALAAIAHFFGYEVVAVFMDTPLDVCLARNQARKSKEPVPDQVIRRMHKNLVRPSKEYFDELIRVSIESDGSVVESTTAWPNRTRVAAKLPF